MLRISDLNKFTSILAILAAFGLAAPAMAQDANADIEAEAQAEANAEAMEAKPSGPKLDEIIVTAQKRAEDVRDVPIAMSVMSGEQMRDNGITDMNEAATLIPNVSINTDFYAMYIRGIGTAEANVLAEQAIGFIIDGVYLARIEFLRPGFIDVERMEVLRGPQGTLFGRNSPAGVINITSGTPSDEWTGRFELAGGEREMFDARATLGGPIVDDLSFRITAGYNEKEGHTKILNTGGTAGDRENMFVKGRLRWDITDGLDATLTATAYDYDVRQMIGVEQHNTPDEYETMFLTLDPQFEDEVNREGTSDPEGSGSTGEGLVAGLKSTWTLATTR